MNVAAVPEYVLKAAAGFRNCPPGHRFNLYFELWQERNWLIDRNGKANALRQCLALGDAAPLLQAVRRRQHALANALPDEQRQIIDALSTAPFATGLGLEHPVDNGFAFLTPYGLPYLAGSGVKGVLRQAAAELLDDGDATLTQPLIDALFGQESQTADALRGALSCWDVFPVPPGGELVVEIMTPHFNHYYQEEESPHDAGKPTPIPFLAVPARSELRFIVTCNPALLPPDCPEWKSVLDSVVAHAFDWMGFGAKTAVGYGAMAQDPAAVEARQRQQEQRHRQAAAAAEAARLASLSPEEQELEAARASIAVLRNAFETAKAQGPYKAGSSPIDEPRRKLFQQAIEWQSPVARGEAAALLREVIKWTGWPGRKERKQEFQDWLRTLES
ncbi:type III-B CRISPR module RAMP protein Cmr6 [Candidatus Accumulibacter sp. ACC003]|uniref:type III-B CRISPR module RAMP protein Cmr6 n=1 Tax=Candidatus Accumulibacter sp. ACC003 TaxID=2823334 RepID=UPI0025C06C12|nr:type III-B CRISPR module RAMP protein Cmr6 [Candidatus Accumulibacter sp. ACC003]